MPSIFTPESTLIALKSCDALGSSSGAEQEAEGQSGKPASDRFPGLDVLRGISALIVFLFHFIGLADKHHELTGVWGSSLQIPIFLGSLGTNMLLLLCGFMIAKSLRKPSFTYFSFLESRFLRIYVPYALVVGAAICFWGVFPAFAKRQVQDIDLYYLASQFLLFPGLFSDRPVLTVSWTLSIIFSAYCLLPALAISYRRLAGSGSSLLPLWLFLLIAAMVDVLAGSRSPIRICYVPLGCLVAEILLSRKLSPSKDLRFLGLCVGFIVSALAMRFALTSQAANWQLAPREYTFLFWSCGAVATTIGVVLALYTSQDLVRNYLLYPLRALRFVGHRGYSFYLLHGPVSKAMVFLMGSVASTLGGSITLLMICFACSLIASHWMYRLMEVQFVGWLRAMLQGKICFGRKEIAAVQLASLR